MLTIDIRTLQREGRLHVDTRIPVDDPLWEGSGLTFDDALRVDVEATVSGSGEIVVRGSIEGTLRQECRRCLEPVFPEVEDELTLVFSPRDEMGSTDEDPELRVIDPGAVAIALGEAIREELMLDVDRYVVCDPECEGLCPVCGIDRNEEECDCTLEEPDPRWDALRALKTE